MTEEQKTVPKWILIVSGLFALLELGVSVSMFLVPESFQETVDIHAKGVIFLIYMWAARQFALGFIFAFATIRKSSLMLTLAYLFFLVMFVGDFLIGVVLRENALIVSGLVMCTVSSAMLFAINGRE